MSKNNSAVMLYLLLIIHSYGFYNIFLGYFSRREYDFIQFYIKLTITDIEFDYIFVLSTHSLFLHFNNFFSFSSPASKIIIMISAFGYIQLIAFYKTLRRRLCIHFDYINIVKGFT